MLTLGLTGSIGMGKTTTAAMFRARGVPVHDADATVHRLYAGDAVPLVEAAFPGATLNGVVDRARLAAAVVEDAGALKRLEAIVHPLVAREEVRFLDRVRTEGRTLVVLDIPLLFEAGADARVDAVLVVTASPDAQRRRVLSRPGMTEEKLAALLARQLPDAEKRRRAHFLVDTGHGLEPARRQVDAVLRALRYMG
jgi:dephospho-CoA kinase